MFLSRLPARLARTIPRLGGPSAARFSLTFPPQNSFDFALLRLFPDPRGLRFLQIGANDGCRVDPLFRYIQPLRWQGAMFEPLQRHFAGLSARYGSDSRIRLHCAAIDLKRGERLIYDLAPEIQSTLPDWAAGLASFDPGRLDQVVAELGLSRESIVSSPVRTLTWEDVWSQLDGHRCDVLVVDTEGYDITLLRAADLARHRPRIVHFEHACNTTDERFGFYRELTALGYELATDVGDTTAWLQA